jgi:hypothetical protein
MRKILVFGTVEIWDKKSTGNDDVLGVVLKLLGEDRRRLITQVFNDVYETAERYRD